MPDPQSALITQQLKHTVDLLRREIEVLRRDHDHDKTLTNHRLTGLESCSKDHETRLRVLQDSAARSKVVNSLASGGSTFMSFVALLRTFLIGS